MGPAGADGDASGAIEAFINDEFAALASDVADVETAVDALTPKVRSYLVIEGESTAAGQVLWSCGASCPMVGKFGLQIPYGTIHTSMGLTSGDLGAMNSFEVTLAACSLYENTVPMRVIQFNKHSTEDMLFSDSRNPLTGSNQITNMSVAPHKNSILVLENAVAKDLNGAALASVPPHVRFRLTLEFEKVSRVDAGPDLPPAPLPPKYPIVESDEMMSYSFNLFPISSSSPLQVSITVDSKAGNPRFIAYSYADQTMNQATRQQIGSSRPLVQGTMNFEVAGVEARYIMLKLQIMNKGSDAFTVSSFKVNEREQLDVIPFVKKFF
jgi:hypothetical protein